MIVLFMYMCSLAARLKSESNRALMARMLGFRLIALGLLSGNLTESTNLTKISLSSVYHFSQALLLIFLIVYLLIGLIVVLSVANKFEGPLKNRTNES